MGKKTNELGEWSFENLIDGTYRILLDIPGLRMDTVYSVIISEPNTNISNLNYYVDIESGIYSEISAISNIDFNQFGSILLYPNPAIDELTLVIEKADQVENLNIQSIELLDMNGKKIHDFEISYQGKKFIQKLQIDGLNKGFYFIRINNNGINKIEKLVLM